MNDKDTFTSISGSRAKSLARMMDIDGGNKEVWMPNDLKAILDHQLSAAVEVDLATVDASLTGQIRTLAEGAVPPIKTFRDLLTHRKPPLELLEWTKRFAKRCRSCPDSPLPDEVATVLYFLAIVVARATCGVRISGLDDQALGYGLQWALAQSWLDADSRRLFQEAR
jgi:hypothetical protein